MIKLLIIDWHKSKSITCKGNNVLEPIYTILVQLSVITKVKGIFLPANVAHDISIAPQCADKLFSWAVQTLLNVKRFAPDQNCTDRV